MVLTVVPVKGAWFFSSAFAEIPAYPVSIRRKPLIASLNQLSLYRYRLIQVEKPDGTVGNMAKPVAELSGSEGIEAAPFPAPVCEPRLSSVRRRRTRLARSVRSSLYRASPRTIVWHPLRGRSTGSPPRSVLHEQWAAVVRPGNAPLAKRGSPA